MSEATPRLKNHFPLMVLIGAIGLVSIGLFGKFLFGEKLLLFTDIGSDTFYNYYAIYYFLAGNISDWKFPLWTFNTGAGSSVIMFYQFLYDPFSIVYYIGGEQNISRLIAWVFVLKTFCAAVFAYLYLRYLEINPYISVGGSLLFAFNGFLMVFGQHYFYSSWVVFLPLLLYTIEVWLRANKWLPLALCVSFMVLNIAIFWQMIVFCGFYIVCRLGYESWNRNKLELAVRLVKTGGVFALGLGISAVLWLPEYALLKSSPRVSLDFYHVLLSIIYQFTHLNTQDYYWSLLARFFSNNLQGIGSNYTGFLNYYESIQLYVGVLPLLILPQLYAVFSPRAKLAASIALLATAAILVFPGFSQVMNGFQYPIYRWGYNIIMFELALAALVMDSMLKQNRIDAPILVATGLSLFLIVVLIALKAPNLNPEVFKFSVKKAIAIVTLIVFYSSVLYWLIKGKRRNLTFSFLLLLICGELIFEHHDSFNKRQVMTKGIELDRGVVYFDFGNQAVQELKSVDPSVFRIEKNHWVLSLNDSLVQGYYGLDSYNSLNNPSYIGFLKAFDPSGWNINIVKWSSLDHPYLADLLSVKYHLTKNSGDLPRGAAYLGNYGDVHAYKREGHLPFGFTYDSYIPAEIFNQLSKGERERALLQGAVLEEGGSTKLKPILRIAPISEDDQFREALRKDVLDVAEMSGDKIEGNLHLESGKLLFLSLPYDRGWTALVNGKNKKLYNVNLGFTGLFLDRGVNNIELVYIPPYMKIGSGISAFSVLTLLILLVRRNKSIST